MIFTTTSFIVLLTLIKSIGSTPFVNDLLETDTFKLTVPGTKASAIVHLYGATILSWEAGGKSLLFMSSKAVLNGTQPIRGGIPIVFPQFNKNGVLPPHGFARVSRWTLTRSITKPQKSIKAYLKLSPSAIPLAQRLLWPFDFDLQYIITLSEFSLKTEFVVQNTDTEPFNFVNLLHTYFLTDDIGGVALTGLKGLTYDDFTNKTTRVETRKVVTINQETNRVYKNVSDTGLTLYLGSGTTVKITKTFYRDTVVWNPWAEKSKTIVDLGSDDYKKMICVETGSIVDPIKLEAGQSWSGSQTLSVL